MADKQSYKASVLPVEMTLLDLEQEVDTVWQPVWLWN